LGAAAGLGAAAAWPAARTDTVADAAVTAIAAATMKQTCFLTECVLSLIADFRLVDCRLLSIDDLVIVERIDESNPTSFIQ
jgi:hypothetical protein